MKTTAQKTLLGLGLLLSFVFVKCSDSIPEKGIYTQRIGDFLYTYKDGVLNGRYAAFYENGNIWAEGNYENGQLNGPFKTYMPDKRLAVEEEWKKGSLFYQKVYWQPIIYNEKKFLFVSKEGFVTMTNGRYLKLDESTPDNIMQPGPTGESIIWKNGKSEVYK
jgi:antitoxin component YwqK of YwqJK toxin-antitoxin module